jgi:phosphopantothenoylcysteine decarboxylase/phosphopantothenate--cysteine ligase
MAESYDLTEKRKVLLGVTGSIAAYKSAELARLFVSWGYEVRCVLTDSAQQFITPVTMQAVTGNTVITDFWSSEASGTGHIEAASWADVVVIAPATADFIAKLSSGFADSPLLAICLATKAPILVAPAMNVNMYEHALTQKNIAALIAQGVSFAHPEVGALACGWNGTGRLAEPMEIFYQTRRLISRGDFHGKHVVIATGPTREPIDPVRFISNRSSGKMGIALAREAYRRGAQVTVIHGPVKSIKSKLPKSVTCVEAVTADEMCRAMMEHTFPKEGARPDVVIMAAAVADFKPAHYATSKIKKHEASMVINLEKNEDILHALGAARSEDRVPALIGFAVETGEIEDLISEARRKLETKSCDLIVGNFAEDALELDTNHVWLVDRNGRQEEVQTTYKSRVANKILDRVLKL